MGSCRKTPLRSAGPKTGDSFEVYVYRICYLAAFEAAILDANSQEEETVNVY